MDRRVRGYTSASGKTSADVIRFLQALFPDEATSSFNVEYNVNTQSFAFSTPLPLSDAQNSALARRYTTHHDENYAALFDNGETEISTSQEISHGLVRRPDHLSAEDREFAGIQGRHYVGAQPQVHTDVASYIRNEILDGGELESGATHLPFLSKKDALAWKEETESQSVIARLRRTGADNKYREYWDFLSEAYKGQDFTILIDNSTYMKHFMGDVIECAGLLSFCVLRSAKDGIDLLRLYGSDNRRRNFSSTKAITKHFQTDGVTLSPNEPADARAKALDEVLVRLHKRQRRRQLLFFLTRYPGIDVTSAGNLREDLEILLKGVQRGMFPSLHHITIQIINFEIINFESSRRTKLWTSDLGNTVAVDVESWWQGNVIKMLLGSLPTSSIPTKLPSALANELQAGTEAHPESVAPRKTSEQVAQKLVLGELGSSSAKSKLPYLPSFFSPTRIAMDERQGQRAERVHGFYHHLRNGQTELRRLSITSSTSALSAPESSGLWVGEERSTVPTSVSGAPQHQYDAENPDQPALTFYDYHRAPITKVDKPAEVASIISIDDDIQSQVSSTLGTLAPIRQAAVHYLVDTLTQDSDLFALYQDATRTMTADKFVRNHRRLLKRLLLGLDPEDQTPSYKLTLTFLRSRNQRTQISSEIYRVFSVQNGMIRKEISIMVREQEANFPVLNRYLEGLDNAADVHGGQQGFRRDIPRGRSLGVEFPANLEDDRDKDARLEHNDIDEIESDDNESWASSDAEGDEDDQPNDTLSKLEDAAKLITSGRPFESFKLELRGFLHPDKLIGHQDDVTDEVRDTKNETQPSTANMPDLDYSVECSVEIRQLVSTALKKYVECLAASQLSWWPLNNIEPVRRLGSVRVYSYRLRDPPVYIDLSPALAESLFPGYEGQRPRRATFLFKAFGQSKIYLHSSMPADVLDYIQNLTDERREHGNTSSSSTSFAPSSSTQLAQPPQAHLRTQNQASGSSSSSQTPASNTAAPSLSVDSQPCPSQTWSSHDPVLFLSLNLKPNESVARPVKLGLNDKATMQILHREYRRLCARWFRAKHITGVKFYRFNSFLFKKDQNVHHVELHKDKERYPILSDPEYHDYQYRPQPWPDDLSFPGQEVWYYLNNLADCGTSVSLKDRLPIRVKGPIASQTRAFGLHFEEHYSVWIILFPSFVVALLFLVPTGWFVRHWMGLHPGDLQGAAVPASLGVAMLSLVINMHMSLLMFRWTAV